MASSSSAESYQLGDHRAQASAPPTSQSLSEEVKGGIESWTAVESDQLPALLRRTLGEIDTRQHLSTIPLSFIISSAVDALTLPQLIKVCTATLDGYEEGNERSTKSETFGEVLVDVVESANQGLAERVKADPSWVPSEEGGISEKGILLLQSLLASGHVPQYIVNLGVGSEILHFLRLLPGGHQGIAKSVRDSNLAAIRRTTALCIKQSKYNLLRESSEGFAGVIVLLLSDEVLLPESRIETEQAVSARAARVWGKLLGLTGQFDLAPPRILDLILEVAGSQVAHHYRFFLELIRCTPWGLTGDSTSRKGKAKAVEGDWKQEEAKRIQEALSVEGDGMLAKVLGNKLRAYRDEDTPMGLIYFTALLLKFNFVGLRDLLPFMTPSDDGMDKLRKDWLVSLDPRKSNALAMAAALVDDDAPDAKPKEESKETAKDTPERLPSEQIPMLVQALLSIGSIPLAQSFLARYPWLAQSHPAVTDMILLIVSRALEPAYQSCYRLDTIDDDFDWDAPGPFHTPLEGLPTVVSLWNPPPVSTPLHAIDFFYADWDEQLEEWHSLDDVFEKSYRWLGLVRGATARNPGICVKLCRMATAYFEGLQKEKEALDPVQGIRSSRQLRAVQPTEEEMSPWLSIVRQVLLPALSCSTDIAPFGAELWSLFRHLPYHTRFALYGDWRDTCESKSRNTDPLASKAAREATEQTKHVLRRIVAKDDSAKSTDAEKATARSLASASFANPLSVLDRALQQVKTYSNLGEYIVEACRYLEPLAMDVAIFSTLDILSTPNLAAPQGALNDPLTNVANFLGEYARRYVVDLEPVFRFILNRLSTSSPTELVVLDRLVVIMAGLTPMEDNAVSNDQLKALSGGIELVKEAISATTIEVQKPVDPTEQGGVTKQVKIKKPKVIKHSLPRLLAYCRDEEFGLPIWIALAQTYRDVICRPSLVDDEYASDGAKWDKWTGGEPPKTMSERLDSIHASFGQFGDLISEYLTLDQLVGMTPDLTTLVHRDDLSFPPAFRILRPKLFAVHEKQRLEEENKRKEEKKLLMRERLEKERNVESTSPSKKGDMAMSPAESATPTLPGDDADHPMNGAHDVAMTASSDDKDTHSYSPTQLAVMDETGHLLPEGVNSLMRSPFFVTFWQLTLADIDHSSESYDNAIKRVSQMEKEISGWRARVLQSGHFVQKDIPENRQEVARLAARRKVLESERVKQKARKEQTIERLQLESRTWFAERTLQNDNAKRLAHQLVEWCVFPRACLGPSDAIFAAKFIMLAHRFAAPGFSTLYVYQHLFDKGLSSCIYTRTLTEARNYGRCLGAMLEIFHKWHADEKVYNQEAIGASAGGHARPGLDTRNMNSEGVVGLNTMNWRQFRNMYARLQDCLSQALTACLGEDDFMHVQNAITVGLQIVKYFPIMKPHGEAVTAAVTAVNEGKTGPGTPDVQFQAQGYLRTITVARRDPRTKAVVWVQPADFHSGRVVVNASDRATKSAPQPATQPATSNADVKPDEAVKTVPEPKALDMASTSNAAELKARLQAAKAAGPARDETKPAGPMDESKIALPSRPATPGAVPAGPRADRDRGTPTAPTGPSANRHSPAQASPARLTDNSMAPPAQTLEEARKAERAKRFASSSSLAENRSRTSTPTPSVPPRSETISDIKSDAKHEARASPAPSSKSHTSARPPTPPLEDEKPARARSRSVESRISERSRRSRRDRGDAERDRRDIKRDDRDQPANGNRSRASSIGRQQEMLRARDDTLGRRDDDRGDRRSSRDVGRRDRDEQERRDKERRSSRRDEDKGGRRDDERKEKDSRRGSRREDRDRNGRDDGKRKRDEDPRREDRRDPRGDGDGRDRHEATRPREREQPRGGRDARERNDREPSHRRESERGPRDGPEGPRGDGPPAAKRASPERGVSASGDGPRRDSAAPAQNVDVGLPVRPADDRVGDRIVEAPRSTRGSEHRGTTNGNGLPTRPARSPIRETGRPHRPSTPPLPAPPRNDLLSRMAPAQGGVRTPPASERREDRAGSETRKRQRDDEKPASGREASVEGDKKRKLDRSRAKRDDAGSRLLSSAMNLAHGRR